MKNYKLILLAFYGLLIFNPSPILAQQKRNLTPEDYKLWSEFGGANMSENGDWIYYSLHYKETDTLYLQNSKTDLKYCFPKSFIPAFAPNSKWFGFINKDSLTVLELDTGKKYFVSSAVIEYDYSSDSGYLISTVKTDATISLKIVNLKTFKAKIITDVLTYKMSPDKSKFAFVTHSNGLEVVKVIVFATLNAEKIVVSDTISGFKGLHWDESGKKLAFFKEMKAPDSLFANHILYWCTGFDGKFVLKSLDANSNKSFEKKSYISYSRLYLSEKSNKVFFDIKPIPDVNVLSNNRDAVQIWLSEDLTIPPSDASEKLVHTAKWTLWDTDTDVVLSVEDDEHRNAILTGNEDNALLYSLTELTPLHKYGGEFIAVYVKDLRYGEKQLLLPKQSRNEKQVIVSPAGKYIAYFMDANWWVYDISLQKHRCLTVGMPLSLSRLDYDRPGLIPALGSPGWTTGDNEIIIYDQFDIWLLKPDGSSKKRITNGEKTSTIYRLSEKELKPAPRDSFFGFQVPTYDFHKSIVLKTQNNITLGEGYAIYSKDGSIKTLFENKSIVHLIDVSKNGTEFLFIESNFELPPRLFTINLKGKEKLIKQSNLHQKNFFWSTSSLLNYTTKQGKKLKGALFYPANYDVHKKYPMLVCIYERKSKEVLDYIVPSIYSMYGFNTSNYTTEGYFVLYLDIAYGINTTGNDALECITAALNESLRIATIDKSKIALIGHSFGGYETAYIMGHTDLFKTAVIGAPMIDLVSAYLTLDGHGLSNMWRFEYDQFRIPAPFYSDTFDSNSPLKSAKNIKAPILLWTGTADKQLDWKHSMKLHNALWRLGKKSTMLVYPDEEHVLVKDRNQLDLTMRIKEWMDYYLKDGPLQKWMGKQ